MSNNFITMATAAAVFTTTLWFRRMWAAADTTHGRYYALALLLISAMVILITTFRLVRQLIKPPNNTATPHGQPDGKPRQHYRIQYEHAARPQYVQKYSDPEPVADFSCPVWDVSETGMSLACSGLFSVGDNVQGEIIFHSGRSAPVNGVVIREDTQRTGLRLHCTIDPKLLMAEQREQIIQTKASGPRPVVSESVLGDTAPSLPSHTPKGLCRLKRS